MEPTQEPFERVAILGLGLMGASLGMALRAAGVARLIEPPQMRQVPSPEQIWLSSPRRYARRLTCSPH